MELGARKDRPLSLFGVTRLDSSDAKPARACFATYGSARHELIQLWFEAQKLKAAAAKGAPLTTVEKLRLRRKFRCDGDKTTGTIDGPCVNGPPNLGYAYGKY